MGQYSLNDCCGVTLAFFNAAVRRIDCDLDLPQYARLEKVFVEKKLKKGSKSSFTATGVLSQLC